MPPAQDCHTCLRNFLHIFFFFCIFSFFLHIFFFSAYFLFPAYLLFSVYFLFQNIFFRIGFHGFYIVLEKQVIRVENKMFHCCLCPGKTKGMGEAVRTGSGAKQPDPRVVVSCTAGGKKSVCGENGKTV